MNEQSFKKSYFYINKLMNLIGFTQDVYRLCHTSFVIENLFIYIYNEMHAGHDLLWAKKK